MSKSSKSKRHLERAKEKRGIKERRREQYAAFAAAGRGKNSKRAVLKRHRIKQIRVVRHRIACHNTGCSKCSPTGMLVARRRQERIEARTVKKNLAALGG